MSTIGGSNSILVTSNNINSITLSNSVIVDAETGNVGPDGGYQLKCYRDVSGDFCTTNTVYLELNDSFPWTNISCEIIVGDYSACWGFNNSQSNGHLLPYSEVDGDIIPFERCKYSWEYPEFQTHNKVWACDNESNNFFHPSFQKGDPKSFLMRRRRDTSGSLAGIYHNRACSSTGTGSYIIIRKIHIW